MKKLKEFINDPFRIVLLLVLAIIIAIIIYRSENRHLDELYFKKYCIVVKVGQESGLSDNRFHTPTVSHTILVRDLNDSTLFMEWKTTKEKYYNYNIGDTIFFDYIRKDSWFKINLK